jgi:hypothetical protein
MIMINPMNDTFNTNITVNNDMNNPLSDIEQTPENFP